ncbi:hypothetical protein [Limnohabitans sp.]|uniref:hypothetical protein n=1 Tax=Limnohabitans sp. TaxID=1907725 RepID=UPI0035AF4BA9
MVDKLTFNEAGDKFVTAAVAKDAKELAAEAQAEGAFSFDSYEAKIIQAAKVLSKETDDQRYELITVKRRNEGVVSRGHLIGREILVKNYAQLKGVTSSFPSVKWSTGLPPSCRLPWMAPSCRMSIGLLLRASVANCIYEPCHQ